MLVIRRFSDFWIQPLGVSGMARTPLDGLAFWQQVVFSCCFTVMSSNMLGKQYKKQWCPIMFRFSTIPQHKCETHMKNNKTKWLYNNFFRVFNDSLKWYGKTYKAQWFWQKSNEIQWNLTILKRNQSRIDRTKQIY